jgi:hypothetical protein
MNTTIDDIITELPIYGLVINDGENAPFADLYLDTFPESYDVE